MTAQTAAAALGVSPRTVRRAILRGDLPAVKFAGTFRILPADFERFERRLAGSDGAERRHPAHPLPPPDPLSLPPLPAPLTSFVGREALVSALADALRSPETRLLTLTGPGGVGKTRLAVTVAATVAEDFPGGVGFIPLAAVREPSSLLPSLALQLGLRDDDRGPLVLRIQALLNNCRCLLVLDNFEQILNAAPALVELLSVCPHLVLLVTSRAPLRVSAEQTRLVPPLSLPPAVGAAEAADSEAVRLFLTRARAINPDILLTEETAMAIATICARLDGLPLAIELAAARANLLPAPAMLARLDRRLPFLSGGVRDQPARQRTMRDAIAWSYRLLTAEEQALFRRLSVFVGGFTLDEAEAIAEAEEDEVFDRLKVLIDHSLVRAVLEEGGEEPRFTMLETIREFGLDQLSGAGEEDPVRAHHARYFVDLAERIGPEVDGADAPAHLALLDLDRPNVQSAQSWLVRHGRAAEALRLGSAMWRYWRIRGHLSEGRDYLVQALALPGEATAPIRAEALWKLGYLEFYLGDFAVARAHLEQGVALFDAAGDRRGLATALDALGVVLRSARDPVLAVRHHQRALALRRDLGDHFGQALPLANLGMLALDRGALDEARALFQQALEITRVHGSQREIASRLLNLAQLELVSRNLDRAREHADQALAALMSIGDLVATISTREMLGGIDLAAGRGQIAGDHFLASLRLRFRFGLFRDLAEFVEQIARSVLAWDPELAVRLMAAADESRAAAGLARMPRHAAEWEQATGQAAAALGAERFADIWQAGRNLPIFAAAHDAEQALASMTANPAAASPASVPSAPSLSPRELDVLRLVAAGHANPAIAAVLYISPATVKRHVTNILAKLGLDSRAAAIVYAHRHGLGQEP
jgi:excisionase family DNA binding protein